MDIMAILPLIYHCVFTHDAWALASGPSLSYHVLKKYLFLQFADSIIRNTIFPPFSVSTHLASLPMQGAPLKKPYFHSHSYQTLSPSNLPPLS